MTYPRSHLLDPRGGGVYHVHSRCVRRAWLCGVDEISGRDFSHRRAWIERRILALAETFAVGVYGYAVMSNHYHIVIRLEPERCAAWSDEQVVEKWLSLCPGKSSTSQSDAAGAIRKATLLGDVQRLAELRQRLTSLSWFMRFINEPLARFANKEDGCTGRFWEGRFKSQILLDEAAILACMVYVDLNPVRAGIANDVTDCRFTSLRRRLQRYSAAEPLAAINTSEADPPYGPLSLSDYIALVRWTADAQKDSRRGIKAIAPPAIHSAQVDPEQWLNHYLPEPGCWPRALGSFRALRSYAAEIGQSWIRTRPVIAS